MTCMKKLRLNMCVDKLVSCVISACRKLNSLETVYAGFFVFFVPSVICIADRSSRLTYESIYNNTNYAQLQYLNRPYANRPYATPPISHNYQNRKSTNDTSWNEIDGTVTPIFVGFGRDPFRYSVPKEDYLRGVRHIDPRTYMNKKENRGKRGILHLANMLYCATGCDPISYKGYGCYCGFSGAGRPTDGIDRCCQLHDECYENIYCPFYTVYLQPYLWKCYRGQPLCALENFNSQYQFINGCAGRLCECDRKFAMCIRRYRCPQGRALCHSSPIRLLQNLLMFR